MGMKYRQLNGGERSAAGGVAIGGAEARGDRARTWAASQHGVAGTEAQRGLRWMVSSAARAATSPRAALSVAAGNSQLGREQWERVEALLREEWSPEQVSGHLRLKRELAISHETIYRHIWQDLRSGARCTSICAVRARAAGNATGVTTAEGDWREKNDWGAASQGGAAAPVRPWEIDTMMGEVRGRAATAC